MTSTMYFGDGLFGDGVFEAALWATPQTAAADGTPVARVLVVLGWDVTHATINRVNPDGSRVAVRNADPGGVAAQLVVYDHECPLDVPISYEATSADAPGVTQVSNVVTLASGDSAWLGHPALPATNAATVIPGDIDGIDLTYPARRGVFAALGRADAVIVSDVRSTAQGTVTIQVGTQADWRRVRAMCADGTPLILRLPAAWSGDTWYLSVGDLAEMRFTRIAGDAWRRYPLPVVATSRPDGRAGGAIGVTCADIAATYATCAAIAASGKTCYDLATGS
ncbi:MAG TPA: hypothetical protein VL652_34720 [Kutzneria sp.]|jgi:hypothetical protein|nr:hypothetical protein [Kutzneria sp.]